MNKNWFFIFILATMTFMVACQSPINLNPFAEGLVEEISLSDIPDAIQDVLNRDFADRDVEEAVRITAPDRTEIFGVRLTDGRELSFRGDGQRCNDTIAIADLPQSVLDYVDQEYAGEMIVKAVQVEKRDGSTIFVIRISSGEVLAFDETGAFLGEREGRRKKRRDHLRRHAEMIDIAALPQTAQDYISSTFPDATIDKAGQIERRDGSILFIVKLDTGARLFFDADGNFLEGYRGCWSNSADSDG